MTPVAGGCTALAYTWKVEEEEVADGSPTPATVLVLIMERKPIQRVVHVSLAVGHVNRVTSIYF